MENRILVYGMTDNRGGIESYVMNFYRQMDKSKIAFDFIIDFKEMAYEEEVRKSGSTVYKIPSKRKHPLSHLTGFYKVLKSHPEYNTVYFNVLNSATAYSMLIPHLLKRKVVVHSHNGSDDNMRLHKLFMRLLNRFANKKLACSELAARHMFGDSCVDNGEVSLINNAICVDDFIFNDETRLLKRKELGLNGELAVLHIGRMANQKNPMYLLDIFEELLKLRNDAILLYAGIGEMENDVKNAAKQKGIDQSIRFLGLRDDVPEIMQAADIFLLPSKYEGLPIVAIEAQTADLPCFLSENISSAVKITDNVRFLSIDASPSVWADEIAKYDKAERSDRKKSITDAGYNIENETDKLINILCSL